MSESKTVLTTGLMQVQALMEFPSLCYENRDRAVQAFSVIHPHI